MSDYQTLKVTRDGEVATLSFNRPGKLNAIDKVLRKEFAQAANALNRDESVRVVILTGEGRAFGVGADLSDMEGEARLSGAQVTDMLNHEYKPGILAIHDSPKIWIAAINGPCAGVSYSFAMACDLVAMSEDSYLYQPFSAIGLIPDGGSTWFLPRLVGTRRALELMILGEKLAPDTARELGLVNRVYPATGFAQSVAEFAADIATRSPLALRYTKAALRANGNVPLGEAISNEASLQALCIDSEDATAAVEAFLNKEAVVWRGR